MSSGHKGPAYASPRRYEGPWRRYFFIVVAASLAPSRLGWPQTAFFTDLMTWLSKGRNTSFIKWACCIAWDFPTSFSSFCSNISFRNFISSTFCLIVSSSCVVLLHSRLLSLIRKKVDVNPVQSWNENALGKATSAGGRPRAWLKGLEDQLVAAEDEDAFERGNNVVMELEMRQIWEEGRGGSHSVARQDCTGWRWYPGGWNLLR